MLPDNVAFNNTVRMDTYTQGSYAPTGSMSHLALSTASSSHPSPADTGSCPDTSSTEASTSTQFERADEYPLLCRRRRPCERMSLSEFFQMAPIDETEQRLAVHYQVVWRRFCEYYGHDALHEFAGMCLDTSTSASTELLTSSEATTSETNLPMELIDSPLRPLTSLGLHSDTTHSASAGLLASDQAATAETGMFMGTFGSPSRSSAALEHRECLPANDFFMGFLGLDSETPNGYLYHEMTMDTQVFG